MVSLIWYMMMMTMMLYVCEKEVCLLCAGGECERYRESVVRTRVPRANLSVSLSGNLGFLALLLHSFTSSPRFSWRTSLWLAFRASLFPFCS